MVIVRFILIILLSICLADMPYGYYQFVRFAAMVGFSVLAYIEHQWGSEVMMLVFLALALLFQPFFKIALGRDLWNLVDVIVALGLGFDIVIIYKKKNA